MPKQTDELIDHLVPHLYNATVQHEATVQNNATVQNRRCWALLNHIIQNEIVINAPAATKARTKRKSEARLTELRTYRKW